MCRTSSRMEAFMLLPEAFELISENIRVFIFTVCTVIMLNNVKYGDTLELSA